MYVWSWKPQKGPYVPSWERIEKWWWMMSCYSTENLFQVKRSTSGPAVTLGVRVDSKDFSVDLVPVFMFGREKWPAPPLRQESGFSSQVGLFSDVVVIMQLRGTPQCMCPWEVLTVASMKFRVFWDLAPCSHVKVDWCLRGAYCLHHRGWWRCYIPEVSKLHYVSLSGIMYLISELKFRLNSCFPGRPRRVKCNFINSK
jgi:hypothetical protein